MATARVDAVARGAGHNFSKAPVPTITLVAGIGVSGNAYAGVFVKHRSREAVNPAAPNLREVHLVHAELFDGLAAQGFSLVPGDIGENILTREIDLLALPTGALLRIGPAAVARITSLRNPCAELDSFARGLTAAMIDRGPAGEVIRKAGVMGTVVSAGDVTAGDAITVVLPAVPHAALMLI